MAKELNHNRNSKIEENTILLKNIDTNKDPYLNHNEN